VRRRAISALEAVGDPHAVGPLVRHLFVSGGSGQRVYISQTTQIPFARDFDVEVTQTTFIADPEMGVIQNGVAFSARALGHSGTISRVERSAVHRALAALTGVDLGRDRAAWLRWYRSRR
jgi:hypothetical protein